MRKAKNLTKKQKENLKLDAYPNLYSIVTFWASVLMFIIVLVMDDSVYRKIVTFTVFVASFAVHYFVEKAVRKRIDNSKRTEELKKRITNHARFAGYWGYVVFLLTILLS